MRIVVTGVFVDDQQKALDFYTSILGFVARHDVPVGGGARWLTVVSPDAPEGTELLLEPTSNPDVPSLAAFRQEMRTAGIPAASFAVDDLDAEVARLRGLGVRFTMEPTDAGPVRIARFDDTCGNLIQIAQQTQA